MDQETALRIAQMSGLFALAGAAIGALAGLLGAGIGAWNQRVIARETELRHWRLDQLRPTIDMANKSFAHLQGLDAKYESIWLSRSEADVAEFRRQLNLESGPLANLGHSVAVGRVGAKVLSTPLLQFLDTYVDCLEDVNGALTRSIGARLTSDDTPPSLMPTKEKLGALLDAVLTLNQAVERYAFGRFGKQPTMPEIQAEILRLERIVRFLPRWANCSRKGKSEGFGVTIDDQSRAWWSRRRGEHGQGE